MKKIFEDSTNIKEFVYNGSDKTLVVEFTNSNRYEFKDVPTEVVDEFSNATSAGKFFSTNIRGNYRYNKQS